MKILSSHCMVSLNGFCWAFDASALDIGWQWQSPWGWFFFFLSNSTREVEIKLSCKYVDENTKWKIYVQVLSIQNVNFYSHALPIQTQFSRVCTHAFLLQSTANASQNLIFFRDSFSLSQKQVLTKLRGMSKKQQ